MNSTYTTDSSNSGSYQDIFTTRKNRLVLKRGKIYRWEVYDGPEKLSDGPTKRVAMRRASAVIRGKYRNNQDLIWDGKKLRVKTKDDETLEVLANSTAANSTVGDHFTQSPEYKKGKNT